MCSVVTVLGLAALIAGGAGFVVELGRRPTAAELNAAAVKEQAARWRLRTAGEIFPVTVRNASGKNSAHRVGIAPPASCAQALDRQVAAAFVKQGCRTVLRATYIDASGTLVTTVGIAVMPDAAKAETAAETLVPDNGVEDRYGLRAAGFPGTVAARFGDAQRQKLSHADGDAPYVVLRASGWWDGRTKVPSADLAEPFATGEMLVESLMSSLVRSDDPCRLKDVRC